MNLRQFIKGHWSALIGGCLVLLLEVIQETGYVMNNDEKHFEHNVADCFNVRVPLPGAPGRIFHVGLVLNQVEEWAKQHPQEKVIVCILECRIGPLLIPHAK